MHIGPLARATVAVVLLLTLSSTSALAQQSAPRLRGQVTDLAGILDEGQRQTLEDRLDSLHSSTGVQLFVLYVRTFESTPSPDYAKEVARVNSLGGDDALLAVAFDDRAYALWVPDSMPDVTDQEIDTILVTKVEPALRANDPLDAPIAAVEGLGEALKGDLAASQAPTPEATAAPAATPTAAPAATPTAGVDTSGGSGGGLAPWAIVGLVLLVVGGLMAFALLRARRPAATPSPNPFTGATTGAPGSDVDAARLRRESTTALVEADEAIRDADTELAAAEAQWGPEPVRPMRDGVDRAREDVRAAFEIRHRIDDDQPEPAPERTAMYQRILERTAAARDTVETELVRLAALRDLEHNAPQLLESLAPQLDQLAARRAAAEASLKAVTDQYGPTAVKPVDGNLAEADKAVAGARAELARGRVAASSGDLKSAAVALRHVEDAMASTSGLIDGVERLRGDLAQATAQVEALITEVVRDVANAHHALDQRVPADPALSDRLRAAEDLLEQARDLASAPERDPLTAVARATAANAAIDEVLATIQRQDEMLRRQQAALAATIASARASVDRARDHIATRRHGVGDTPRAALAEAERLLAEADRLAATDIQAAAARARDAQKRADDAYTSASREFDAWQPPRGPVAGPYRDRADTDLAAAVLGGIIGGILGSGRGSGWGGSSWGSPGPFGGGGGFGWPSDGGGSDAGRLGGGGVGSGDGGGRARGGRW
jgi:uncharacterized membrane protein YgcG